MTADGIYRIKQGDNLPVLKAALSDTDPASGLPRIIDLTACTVATHWCVTGTTLLAFTKAASIVDAGGGVVQVALTAVESAALAAGSYRREWQITFANGDILTVPNGVEGVKTIVERQIG